MFMRKNMYQFWRGILEGDVVRSGPGSNSFHLLPLVLGQPRDCLWSQLHHLGQHRCTIARNVAANVKDSWVVLGAWCAHIPSVGLPTVPYTIRRATLQFTQMYAPI